MGVFANDCDDVLQILLNKTPEEQLDALMSAAVSNDVITIQAIINHTDTNCNKALFYAASQGHTQAVEALLQRANPKANESEAFRIACQFGMLDVVKLLLPLSDPQANHNHPLRAAAGNGNVDVVEYILPHTNPKDINSSALLSAAYNQHWEIADMLLELSDVEKVRQGLQKSGPGPWKNFEQEVQSRRQKCRLENEVGTIKSCVRQKKI